MLHRLPKWETFGLVEDKWYCFDWGVGVGWGSCGGVGSGVEQCCAFVLVLVDECGLPAQGHLGDPPRHHVPQAPTGAPVALGLLRDLCLAESAVPYVHARNLPREGCRCGHRLAVEGPGTPP